MSGRAHAAGKVKGRIAARYGLHEAVDGLGLPHVGFCLGEYLRAHEIAGRASGQNHAVLANAAHGHTRTLDIRGAGGFRIGGLTIHDAGE